MDHTQANNLSDIVKLTSGDYEYKAKLALASDNTYVKKLIGLLGKQGTTLEMGDVSLSNPAGGIDFFFNLSENKQSLDDFKFSASLGLPIKGINTVFTLTYEQKADNSTINIPSIDSLVFTQSAIETEMNVINNAISAVKNSDAYSLDFEAVNEFDPGWNVNAIVDKYLARQYKNTNGERVDFNQSYEYKSHSEEDGAETYKYTYGNIQDGSVYLVSRKGTNAVEEALGITVDTQFDYLTTIAKVGTADIDCIRKEQKDGITYYNIYMKQNATLDIKDKITTLINSNNAADVQDVDNLFNNNSYTIKESEMVVAVKAGKVLSITVDTEIIYCPTGGEYTEEQITLTNSIALTVDENLDKALKYEAPERTNTVLGSFGLNNAKFYVN